jgi:hypothetical protein
VRTALGKGPAFARWGFDHLCTFVCETVDLDARRRLEAITLVDGIILFGLTGVVLRCRAWIIKCPVEKATPDFVIDTLVFEARRHLEAEKKIVYWQYLTVFSKYKNISGSNMYSSHVL